MFPHISTSTLVNAFGSLALAGGALAGYALRFEPRWVEVVRLSLSFPRLPPSFDGLTIAHLSDLHAGLFVPASQVRRFVDMTNALQPDMVVVTGDMFRSLPREVRMCAHELVSLRAPLGVYAIMGNHERRLPARLGEQPFRDVGLTVLCNAAHEVRVDGASLWLVGLDDMLCWRGNLTLALRHVPEQAFKILMVHEPDYADYVVRRRVAIDLQLSGHSHGGQIRLPGVGPLLLPFLGRKYPMGLYRVGKMWLYTNRGLGVAFPPFRFCCRPEITLLTLRAE